MGTPPCNGGPWDALEAEMSLFPDEPLSENREIHPRIYLGTAGWSYDDWDGVFYPKNLAPRDRLAHYARRFRSVEIDSTFYGTPSRKSVQHWYERSPDDFIFSAKFPRSITHDARLLGCADETYRFIEVMTELGEKLGPLLLQFPPSFSASAFGDLESFFHGLPDGLMYVVEIRHPSWLTDEFAELLKTWGVGLCLTCDGALNRFWRVTSRIVYIRWLGDHNEFDRFDEVQRDRSEDLDWWVPRIHHLTDHGGVVFGYVNNHYAGHSPSTVALLEQKLRQSMESNP